MQEVYISSATKRPVIQLTSFEFFYLVESFFQQKHI